MTRQRKFAAPLAALGALVALVVLLFPLYAVVVASFENNAQLLGTHYNFLPPTPSFANYSAVISTQGGHIVSTPDHRPRHRPADADHLAARRARAGPLPLPGHGACSSAGC